MYVNHTTNVCLYDVDKTWDLIFWRGLQCGIMELDICNEGCWYWTLKVYNVLYITWSSISLFLTLWNVIKMQFIMYITYMYIIVYGMVRWRRVKVFYNTDYRIDFKATFKSPFCDPYMLPLWHSSVSINKISLFSKFVSYT